ncbi:MAG: hypothetical protein HZA02_03150 [Nitrospinae bacterium]|nr:hypothetical protein [Nitrospinota bacterium]
MPILSNPRIRRVAVPVGKDKAVLLLRNYDTEEYTQFLSDRYLLKHGGRVEDRSMQARIDFIDKLLVGVEAMNEHGQPDYVTYVDPASGTQEKLTPQVDHWRDFVNPSWKIAAALELEGQTAELENATLKNWSTT